VGERERAKAAHILAGGLHKVRASTENQTSAGEKSKPAGILPHPSFPLSPILPPSRPLTAWEKSSSPPPSSNGSIT